MLARSVSKLAVVIFLGLGVALSAARAQSAGPPPAGSRDAYFASLNFIYFANQIGVHQGPKGTAAMRAYLERATGTDATGLDILLREAAAARAAYMPATPIRHGETQSALAAERHSREAALDAVLARLKGELGPARWKAFSGYTNGKFRQSVHRSREGNATKGGRP